MNIQKAILLSVRPEWVKKILNGEKTIDIRKSEPKTCWVEHKNGKPIFCDIGYYDVYIYCAKSKNRKDSLCFVPLPDGNGTWRLNAHWSGITNATGGYAKQYYPVNGKVCAKFTLSTVKKKSLVLNKYDKLEPHWTTQSLIDKAKVSNDELRNYLDLWSGQKDVYFWHIEDLEVFDKPMQLSDFCSSKECKPLKYWSDIPNWDERHKRKTGGWAKKDRAEPIECCRCPSLVGGEDYLDEKSGCTLFDYDCKTKYHKPLTRAPQSWQYVDAVETPYMERDLLRK
jgi:predicted transcriptional regulator